MGRPREFEIEDALDATVKAFWLGGYEGTSLDDLMAATDLHKGSLYKAFGTKRELFELSLRHYMAKVETFHRESLAEDGSPRAALRRWYERSIAFCHDEEGRCRGCLAINTISELGADDPEIKKFLLGYYKRMITLLAQTVTRGQVAGEIRSDLDPVGMANVLFIQMGGFIVGLKAGLPLKQLRASVEQTLALMSS